MSFGVMAPTVAEQAPYTILASKTVGPWVDISRWRAGAVRTPVGATATSYTFNVANDGAGYTLRDAAGAAITQTVVAAKWFALPAAVFNYKQVQLVPNTAPGTDQSLMLAGVDGPTTWRRIGVPIAPTTAPTVVIDSAGAVAGSFYVPAGFTGATVTVEIGATGQFSAVVDAANANITYATTADRLLSLPAAAFSTGQFRIVAVATQTPGSQVEVWLKQQG